MQYDITADSQFKESLYYLCIFYLY